MSDVCSRHRSTCDILINNQHRMKAQAYAPRKAHKTVSSVRKSLSAVERDFTLAMLHMIAQPHVPTSLTYYLAVLSVLITDVIFAVCIYFSRLERERERERVAYLW